MKKQSDIVEIALKNEDVDKCKQFAEAQIHKSGSKRVYQDRGESRLLKMTEDCIIGKLAEIGVYKYLMNIGIESSEPDFTIYKGSRKSFDADISVGESKIHVKSQSQDSVNRYGHSWLLQKTDPILYRPSNNDIIVFTCVSDNICKILGSVKVIDILKYNLIGQCRVPSFRRTKVALYWDQIKKFSNIELNELENLCQKQ